MTAKISRANAVDLAGDLVLVADIGGTHTRVALARGDRLLRETVCRHRNAEYAGLTSVLEAYLGAHGGVRCRGACVAVAGPVEGEKAQLTNLPWTIDKDILQRSTQAQSVAILNDLQAQGYALGHIAADDLVLVRAAGRRNPAVDSGAQQAPRLMIGVGTGFNAAAVHEGQGGRRWVAASEAGHAGMPVQSADALSLCAFVRAVHGFAGVEDVLSGRGLERIYAWQARGRGRPEAKQAAQIMEECAAGGNPEAEAAVAMFVRLLGAISGDLALIHLPLGGVYLVGGVARAMAPYLERFGFAAAFCEKGRFAPFMEQFPVHLVTDDFAALAGSAAYIAQRAKPAP
ncbi:MAG: glucokinase [Rhodobacteraceae bacterium]|nr:glucokinase [Paracoccaceae bacterium]